jgi:large subunit ribosomal protein L32
MAVPKRRTTRSRRDMRRSHDRLNLPALSTNVKTGVTHRRHFILPDGTYRGNVIKLITAKTVTT